VSRTSRLIATLLATVVLALAGCRGAAPSQSNKPDAPALKTLTLHHDPKPEVGSMVRASAEGLPPGRKVDLVWHTVKGGWVIEDYFHFRGKKFTETTRSLGQAAVDNDGKLAAEFATPEDYGGVHEVTVVDNGVPIAQGGIEIKICLLRIRQSNQSRGGFGIGCDGLLRHIARLFFFVLRHVDNRLQRKGVAVVRIQAQRSLDVLACLIVASQGEKQRSTVSKKACLAQSIRNSLDAFERGRNIPLHVSFE
jgi:hypothetical protein